MKNTNEETTSVNVKKKNIVLLVEFCIENRIEFTVSPRISGNEEYEVSFNPTGVQQAIALGMCLRDLKLELNGLKVTSVAEVKASKKPATVVSTSNGSSKKEPVNSPPAFGEEEFSMELGAAN